MPLTTERTFSNCERGSFPTSMDCNRHCAVATSAARAIAVQWLVHGISCNLLNTFSPMRCPGSHLPSWLEDHAMVLSLSTRQASSISGPLGHTRSCVAQHQGVDQSTDVHFSIAKGPTMVPIPTDLSPCGHQALKGQVPAGCDGELCL